ncbi:hypothetical protein DXV76_06260 [Rhodobacteraceae bacterium CCMM004]|nr:hypothetical protein DXV76_06260 [Rhodobacteraceae bacterium CCMM004]
MSEVEFAMILCGAVLNGAVEVHTPYDVSGERRSVRIDCETDTQVIEVGLDNRRSAFDSVHQALFAAHATGKAPMVVMVDTDGREGAEEYQVEAAARAAGVRYVSVDAAWLLRWRMTWWLRARRGEVSAGGPGVRPVGP